MPITAIPSVTDALPLLRECGLPVCDLNEANDSACTRAPLAFFGMCIDGELAGVIGLEVYDTVALLRSLAVAPARRSAGLGRQLVAFVEAEAAQRGIRELFLLTSTAESFFTAQGYALVPRAEAPVVIQGTAQFSGVCPSSAAFLGKRLASA